jgi:hypothetical protein
MNKTTIEFIENNWELLINPKAKDFIALILNSPLASVWKIMELLSSQSLSVMEIQGKTDLHLNTINTIIRTLENKIFIRNGSIIISLSTEVILSKSNALLIDIPDEDESNIIIPKIETKKFHARLPEKHHYKSIQSQSEGRWLFEDKGSSAFRLISPTPDPWDKEWTILPSKQKQKSDNSEYYYRVDFRLFSSADGYPATFMREYYKSVFAYSQEIPLDYYIMPTKDKIYLSYTFYPLSVD